MKAGFSAKGAEVLLVKHSTGLKNVTVFISNRNSWICFAWLHLVQDMILSLQ